MQKKAAATTQASARTSAAARILNRLHTTMGHAHHGPDIALERRNSVKHPGLKAGACEVIH